METVTSFSITAKDIE